MIVGYPIKFTATLLSWIFSGWQFHTLIFVKESIEFEKEAYSKPYFGQPSGHLISYYIITQLSQYCRNTYFVKQIFNHREFPAMQYNIIYNTYTRKWFVIQLYFCAYIIIVAENFLKGPNWHHLCSTFAGVCSDNGTTH